MGLLSKLPYLVSNHRKASAVLTGTGSLDGRIQCQQVGLVSNIADGLSQLRNVVCHLGRFDSLLQGDLGTCIDALSLTLCLLYTFLECLCPVGNSIGILCTVAGFLGICLHLLLDAVAEALDIGGGCCCFFHAGCHFLGNSRHILGTAIHGTYQLIDLRSHLGTVVCLLAHRAQHLPQGFLHPVQSLHHHADLILTVQHAGINGLSQIAICYCIKLFHRCLQRAGNAPGNNDRSCNAHNQAKDNDYCKCHQGKVVCLITGLKKYLALHNILRRQFSQML